MIPIPFERHLKLITEIGNTIEKVLFQRPTPLGHDYDNPLDDPDDGGEALEPQPTVVMSLGPDEQDREWVAYTGSHWRYEAGKWWRSSPDDAGKWWPTSPGFIPITSGPYTEHTAQSLTWRGWAVPAILEVLAENAPLDDDDMSWADWREHVANIIADRIACDPQRAIEALRNEKVIR